uniref:Envelope glycoprotein n=1 Tax=Porcine reproductive and respiratory syndrome virus TaxID=28344 RepID=Q8QQU8_PRRSV|nr:envelope glycoprotein [Porcine reproductive and respiratory syndrome virus]
MRCSHKLECFLTPHSCFWWLFLLCTGLSWSFVDGNDSSSTYQYIYNLTICQLNGTESLSTHFDWAVDTFVLYPGCHSIFFHWVISQQANFLMRSASALCPLQDLLARRYVLKKMYGACAFPALVFFVIRADKNCMACPYARTRFTNFPVDDRGRNHRWKSPMVEKLGKAEVGGDLVAIKHVVLEGVKAQPLTRTSAEQWKP